MADLTPATPEGATPPPAPQPKRNAFTRFLDAVEWLGNLLPHPVTLFALLALGMVLLSGLFGALGLAVEDPRPVGASGRAEDGMIRAVSLMTEDGLRRIFTSLVENFTSFAPLGVVLVAMLGVGVAERSGLLSAAVRGTVLAAPKNLVTFIIVFAGIMSNIASEMGYVVLIPLAGAVYYSLGRHPLAGMAAAFAGVSGGYAANLLIGTIDPLLAGITQEAARLIDPDYTVAVTASWYFMAASVPMIALIGTLVSTYIVEPKIGPYDPKVADPEVLKGSSLNPLEAKEKKGLWAAGLAMLALFAVMALTLWPEGALLRDPETGDRLRSPFFTGFVTWIFFGWSNIGALTAVTGANFLEASGLTGPAIFIGFILICCLVNLTIGSSSAQWAMTSPIFVPMLMLVGYSPELIATQMLFRIGDSPTNIITPMMSYFGLILAWAVRYDRNVGIGTMIAMMLPYSIFFTIGWALLFFVWVFGLGLPVGPGSPTYYSLG